MNLTVSGHLGVVVWFTGLSGAGKTTLAEALATRLVAEGRATELLDAKTVRPALSKGLGFNREDRDAHVRRVGHVANLLANHGVIVLVSLISPYRAVRDEVLGASVRKLEVFVDASLDTCIARDTKGLYKLALAGGIRDFTGVSDPYEAPVAPDVHVQTDVLSITESVTLIHRAVTQVVVPVL